MTDCWRFFAPRRSRVFPDVGTSPRVGVNVECSELGYSLVELLVALVVASIILLIAGQALLLFLRSSRQHELAQTARESASRFNYLVQIETSEARQIQTGSAAAPLATTCPGYTGTPTPTPLFSLVVPEKEGVYGGSTSLSTIYYYAKGASIRRCGPDVENNGVLMHSADGVTPPPYVDGVVMRSAALQVVTSGATSGRCESPTGGLEVSSSRSLVYLLTFTRLGWSPDCATARAKTVFVCNEPSDEMKAAAAKATTDPDYQPLPVGSCIP